MASDLQIEANRRNAERSTGPRTQEGKARASANSHKHGLTARKILVPSEDPKEFERHAADLREELAPQGRLQNVLVDQIIAVSWRLERVHLLESRYFGQRVKELGDTPKHSGRRGDRMTLAFRYDRYHEKALDALGRHEARLERSLYRGLRELRQLQSTPPPEAPKVNLQNEPNLDMETAEMEGIIADFTAHQQAQNEPIGVVRTDLMGDEAGLGRRREGKLGRE